MAKKMHEDFVVYKSQDDEYFLEQDEAKTLKEVHLRVKKPNHDQQREANMVYSKHVNKYIQDGVMPQMKLERVIKQKGIWDADKEKEEKELLRTAREAVNIVSKGNIKKSEAFKWAKKGIKARFELLSLGSTRNNLLNNSAENLAKSDQFNYLVSECTVYSDNGNKFFKDHDDFLRQDSLGNIVTWKAGEQLSKLLYSLDEDFRKDWPEYKFLLKYKFVNDKLQFIDKDGKVVDDEGVPIEEVKEEMPLEAVFLPD